MPLPMRSLSATRCSLPAFHAHTSSEPPALCLRRLHGRVAMRRTTSATPPLSVYTSGVRMKPFGCGAKFSTECVKQKTRIELEEADEDFIPQKRSAKIHDFCFGIPFGGLLFCMGLLGYFFSRSTASLIVGVAPGLATLCFGTLSLKFWRSGRSSTLFILGQVAISAVLSWKYSHAYLLTNRILPWGFYASLSTAMACFYAYVLLAGGNPPPKKLSATSSQ